MPDVESRRISPIDLLVILLSLTAGAAWVVTAWPLLVHIVAHGPKETSVGPSFSREGGYFGWLVHTSVKQWRTHALLVIESFRAAAALLAPLTLAIVGLRLRRPRAPLRHLFRQPGAAGCAAASVVLLIELANGLTNVLYRFDLYRSSNRCQANIFSSIWQFPLGPPSSAIARSAFSLGDHPGLAVGGAYFALAVSGLWRPGSDSVERFARALAMFWLVAALVFLCLPSL